MLLHQHWNTFQGQYKQELGSLSSVSMHACMHASHRARTWHHTDVWLLQNAYRYSKLFRIERDWKTAWKTVSNNYCHLTWPSVALRGSVWEKLKIGALWAHNLGRKNISELHRAACTVSLTFDSSPKPEITALQRRCNGREEVVLFWSLWIRGRCCQQAEGQEAQQSSTWCGRRAPRQNLTQPCPEENTKHTTNLELHAP